MGIVSPVAQNAPLSTVLIYAGPAAEIKRIVGGVPAQNALRVGECSSFFFGVLKKWMRRTE